MLFSLANQSQSVLKGRANFFKFRVKFFFPFHKIFGHEWCGQHIIQLKSEIFSHFNTSAAFDLYSLHLGLAKITRNAGAQFWSGGRRSYPRSGRPLCYRLKQKPWSPRSVRVWKHAQFSDVIAWAHLAT